MDYSIVIPMANAEATVGQQLEALSTQRIEGSWEVIVSDNGSTDGSRAVVESYRDRIPGLRVVDSSSTRGPSHARNVGVAASTGDFLLFVDADDVVSAGWLRAIDGAVRRGAQFVGGPLDYRVLSSSTPLEPIVDRVERWPAPLGFLDWAPSGNCGIRRRIFEEVGGWDTKVERGEDVAFSWSVQLAGHDLLFLPDAVVAYRLRDDLRGYLRQQWGNGESFPLLLRRFGGYGARRDPVRKVMGRWVHLVRTMPSLFGPLSGRWRWLGRLATQVGRLTGSIRYRTLCP